MHVTCIYLCSSLHFDTETQNIGSVRIFFMFSNLTFEAWLIFFKKGLFFSSVFMFHYYLPQYISFEDEFPLLSPDLKAEYMLQRTRQTYCIYFFDLTSKCFIVFLWRAVVRSLRCYIQLFKWEINKYYAISSDCLSFSVFTKAKQWTYCFVLEQSKKIVFLYPVSIHMFILFFDHTNNYFWYNRNVIFYWFSAKTSMFIRNPLKSCTQTNDLITVACTKLVCNVNFVFFLKVEWTL